MAKANDAPRRQRWSPYGHEPSRRLLIRRRQRNIILAAIGIAAALFLYGEFTKEFEQSIDQSRVQIDRDDTQRPVRVGVTPGRTSFSDAVGGQPATSAPPQLQAPDDPFLSQVMDILRASTPLLLVYYLLSRINTVPRGKLAEVNLGVYKGAMPYELITSHARDRVFNYEQAHESVFGKTREDYIFGRYLAPPPPEVRRLLGEKQEPSAPVVKVVRRGKLPADASPA